MYRPRTQLKPRQSTRSQIELYLGLSSISRYNKLLTNHMAYRSKTHLKPGQKTRSQIELYLGLSSIRRYNMILTNHMACAVTFLLDCRMSLFLSQYRPGIPGFLVIAQMKNINICRTRATDELARSPQSWVWTTIPKELLCDWVTRCGKTELIS